MRKRQTIRNKERERVCDILIDTEGERITLETKIGRQTIHMDYDQFIRQVEEKRISAAE